MTTPTAHLAPHVARQIDALSIDSARPLIISDADEVLLQFIAGFERFLARFGLWLDLSRFAIHGNVKDRGTGEAVANDRVTDLLKAFYTDPDAAHGLDALPGAAAVLDRLALRAQIVILTNVKEDVKPLREANLARHAIPYPVIANEGLKGPAVKHLAGGHRAPVFFLDDIPHNITSVKEMAPHVVCLHVVTEPRLAKLIGPAPGADHRTDSWDEIERLMSDHLDRSGY